MEKLSILFPLHVLPTEKHLSTILINNLANLPNKTTNISFIFFVYDQNIQNYSLNDNTIIHFDQYSNAVDILQKIKPDIVFLNEDRSIVDLSFHIACDFLKIPVMCPINHIWLSDYKVSKKIMFSKLKFLFSNRSSTSKNCNSFKIKINFFNNTMKKSNLNFLKILNIKFKLLISQLSTKPIIYSKSFNTLFRLETESSVPILLKDNFPKSNLFVTGNPIYDEVFQRIINFKHNLNSKKINILFAPSQVFEDGIWNKHDSDQSFIQILKILSNNKDKFSITIKIHPVSVNILDYSSLIKKIDSSIPILQKENFLDLLESSDIVIGYPANSTMLRYCLLAKKPIILCNFFNNNSCELLDNNLSFECTSPNHLVDSIFKIIKNNPSDSEISRKFLQENYFKSDGLSTDRLLSTVIKFIKKTNSI